MGCGWWFALAVACGPAPEPIALAIDPADAVVQVVDGLPALQTYRAMLQLSNGDTQDVTLDATFSIDATRIASFQGSALHVDGTYPGRTMIHATADGFAAETTRDGLHASRASLVRLPTFSDRGIQHPKGVESFDFRVTQDTSAARITAADAKR